MVYYLIYMIANLIIFISFLLLQLVNAFSAINPYFQKPVITSPEILNEEINSERVQLSEKNEYYIINGNTEEELQNQMDALGPEDYDGKYYAYAGWSINWDYPYRKVENRCVLYEPITVDVKVIYTLPEWNMPSTASSELSTKWKNYMEKLVLHEKGHKDIAYRNAELILGEFKKLRSFETCDLFLKEMDRIGFDYIDRAHEEDKKYDHETDHGATQGAVFP
jgi:predicted secreted Zn-dependent protease